MFNYIILNIICHRRGVRALARAQIYKILLLSQAICAYQRYLAEYMCVYNMLFKLFKLMNISKIL